MYCNPYIENTELVTACREGGKEAHGGTNIQQFRAKYNIRGLTIVLQDTVTILRSGLERGVSRIILSELAQLGFVFLQLICKSMEVKLNPKTNISGVLTSEY
jgi:hypothetical protein